MSFCTDFNKRMFARNACMRLFRYSKLMCMFHDRGIGAHKLLKSCFGACFLYVVQHHMLYTGYRTTPELLATTNAPFMMPDGTSFACWFCPEQSWGRLSLLLLDKCEKLCQDIDNHCLG